MMPHLPSELRNGLVLRWATTADMDALATFNIRLHTDNPKQPENWLGAWTRDLMQGRHPTTKATDFTLVVDRHNQGKPVSSACLISQTWTYGGIPFGVGRPELIGTDPDYRRRGLVRAQMEALHALSAARGELVQAITGIPWYYRQFGYEMALDLGGGREYFWAREGNDKPLEKEIYSLRPATAVDIPLLMELFPAHNANGLISTVRDTAIWHFGMTTANRESVHALHAYLIEDADGTAVGYVEYCQLGAALYIRELGVRPGHSWRAVCLFLTRELKRRADALNHKREKAITHLFFALERDHPVYQALGSQLERQRKPYAWYMRVPDLPAFLRHIAPALEAHLAGSVLAGHSGVLRLNFYTQHITLVFEAGKLIEVGSYQPEDVQDGDALFPDYTFLQLLFGYRSFAALDAAFADCYADNPEAEILLEILFPQRPSHVVGVG